MRKKSNETRTQILEFVNTYYSQHFIKPSLRTISKGTGISAATICRYLNDMNESGEVEYDRKHIATDFTNTLQPANCIPVLGSVECGPGEEEQQEILQYIQMPEALVGKGTFFALIAKGESMVNAGIHPGDYVIVRQTQTANVGQIVVALHENLSNIKVLAYNDDTEQYYLQSCNDDKEMYADIYPEDLQIQGVAVGVYHSFETMSVE